MWSKCHYTCSAPTGVKIHYNVKQYWGNWTEPDRNFHLAVWSPQKCGLTKKKGESRCGVQLGMVPCGCWGGLLFFIFSTFRSSACNKGLQLLGSAAAVSTGVLLRGSSRQILITCWQTKRQAGGRGGINDEKYPLLPERSRMRKNPLWAEWREREGASMCTTNIPNERWEISFTLERWYGDIYCLCQT